MEQCPNDSTTAPTTSFGASSGTCPGSTTPTDPSTAPPPCKSGDDDESGDEAEEDEDGEPSALDVLSQSEIKFLLGRETELLRLVDAHPRILPRLTRSLVRDRCFGHAQGRISQAFRADPASVPALVSAPPSTTCEDVAGALAAAPGLRAEFEALLEAHAVCWFPVAAAAAGEEGPGRREAGGFRIHVRPSAAGAGQVYVLIRVEDGRDAKPAAFGALPPDGPSLRVPLPEAIEGVYQLIEQEDSALVRAIRDPASKLALQ